MDKDKALTVAAFVIMLFGLLGVVPLATTYLQDYLNEDLNEQSFLWKANFDV